MLPALARELERLLIQANEITLSTQVHTLTIVDRCHCGDDFCATLYTEPRPKGYGRNHRNVELSPAERMVILNIVGTKIASVEVLYRDEIRKTLHTALP